MSTLISVLRSIDINTHDSLILEPAIAAGWIKLTPPKNSTMSKPPLLQSSVSDHFYAVTKILLSPISGVVGFTYGTVRCVVRTVAALWFLASLNLSEAMNQGKDALKGVKRMVTSIGSAIPFFNLIGVSFVLKRNAKSYGFALDHAQLLRRQQTLIPRLNQLKEASSNFAMEVEDQLNAAAVSPWPLHRSRVNNDNSRFFYQSTYESGHRLITQGAEGIGFTGLIKNVGGLFRAIQSDNILPHQLLTILNEGEYVAYKPFTLSRFDIYVSLIQEPKTRKIQAIRVTFNPKLQAHDIINHTDRLETISYGGRYLNLNCTLRLNNDYLIDEVIYDKPLETQL